MLTWSNNIEDYLSLLIKIKNPKIVVTSIDRLPRKPKLPLYIVTNESKHGSLGSHWVAIYIDKQSKGTYFDSFARDPHPLIKTFLKKHTKSYQVNKVQLQKTTSERCGMFCCIFLILCSRNFLLKQIQAFFSPYNHELNEHLVENMRENKCINKFRN